MSNIEGLSELQAKLRNLKGIKENPDALLAGAYVLEAGAKRRAPVDTGFLRASGSSNKTAGGAEVVFTANYAYYQEFGTVRMPAQPYIRPTIDEDGNEIVNAVANQLQKDINDIAKGG